jgi:hypothetical protein
MSTNMPPTEVLVDLGAVYQVSMAFAKETSAPIALDYPTVQKVITEHFKMSNPKDRFTFWTGSDPANTGQQRLFQFLERHKITLRRFAPRDSYIYEPEQLGMDSAREPEHRKLLLQRFSGSIGFAAGVLCNTHRVIFMSDAFQLAEPLVRAAELARKKGRPSVGLAFWKSHLDPRWHQIIGDKKYHIDFLDLDGKQSELFRAKGEPVRAAREPRQGFDDNFLLDKED